MSKVIKSLNNVVGEKVTNCTQGRIQSVNFGLQVIKAMMVNKAMRANKIIRIVFTVVAIVSLVILPLGCQKNIDNNVDSREWGNNKPAQKSFITQKDLRGILSQSKQSTENKGNVQKQIFKGIALGGVVPHHLVAGRLIVDFMEALEEQKPELIVIIGPNHHNLGGKIISGLYDWQTPEGLVRTDEEIVQALLDEKLAVRDEEVLAQEHSIGNIVPFVRHFTSEARIVPVILHHDVSLEEVNLLLDALQPFMEKEKGLLLASVDFSHYLTREQAEEKDKYTLQVMKDFDYTTLFHLNNDYLDSPPSLAAIFRYAERKDISGFEVLGNTNSGEIMKNDVMETTSYFTLVFERESEGK